MPGYVGENFAPLVVMPGDPVEHLERMRLAYIAEIERCAQSVELDERAAILLKLLKLTSVGKLRVEMTATLDRLTPEPNLSQLSREDIERILNDQQAIETTAKLLDEK